MSRIEQQARRLQLAIEMIKSSRNTSEAFGDDDDDDSFDGVEFSIASSDPSLDLDDLESFGGNESSHSNSRILRFKDEAKLVCKEKPPSASFAFPKDPIDRGVADFSTIKQYPVAGRCLSVKGLPETPVYEIPSSVSPSEIFAHFAQQREFKTQKQG